MLQNSTGSRWQLVRRQLPHYWQLMRFHRPIGILLLLWPTLWGLWLAAEGMPQPWLIVVFVLGVSLMRAAGCVINDFADRRVDGHVKRTSERPLITGAVTVTEAVVLFVCLCLTAFGLVLFTNQLTIGLSFVAVVVAFCYPFMKRYTHLPQLVLGVAFSWGVPMAFAAQTGTVRPEAWLVFSTAVVWTMVYDTFYAMVDRDDDLRIGIKSTAILFGDMDRAITAILQLLVLVGLVMVGQRFQLQWLYDISLVVVMALFVYQQFLISERIRERCFRAFLNNNWVGLAVFLGIVADLALLH